jgi:hypothetical protein
MGTLNYTTTVSVDQTVGQCQAILAKAGASHVGIEYEDGHPSGLSFGLRTPHGVRTFRMPVDVQAVWTLLGKQEAAGEFSSLRKAKGTFSSQEHAARVAWRVMKDWLEAQIALLEARMATLDQVMLPYLVVDTDKTLYEAYKARESIAQLEAGR